MRIGGHLIRWLQGPVIQCSALVTPPSLVMIKSVKPSSDNITTPYCMYSILELQRVENPAASSEFRLKHRHQLKGERGEEAKKSSFGERI